MIKKSKILIVDDHPLMAEATSNTLQQIEGIQIIGIAGTGKRCLELVDLHVPNIVFLDYNLPDQYGDEVAKIIKAKYPAIHLVIFSGIELSHLYNYLIGLEVSAVISKESSGTLIKSLVTLLLENFTVIPVPVFHKMRVDSGNLHQTDSLDDDEVHMMTMIVQGLTNEQMAEEVHMSKRTVDNYIRKIYDKLGVKSRAQAVDKFNQFKHIYEVNRRP
ncbi:MULTISPECIES: response regulator transcription factor [unclassified Paenibacillus]|uniref:response regulator transcription factor n=1 Tax=unclassified Paenibacillus TaxID=185978 RepID=UPI00070A9254|nr:MULTISPECIES: response regulator transcription factor [unclassified Paenibacillus]KQX48258.1 two-component system response regulator [Paenibacillus sp. Root444D2]KRE52224.1 two-component system response regulator [Paenibacillus sp. Soil724D2]